jgi:hypothetical protein
LRIQCTTESVAVKISPRARLATWGILSPGSETLGSDDLFRLGHPMHLSVGSGNDPAELALG